MNATVPFMNAVDINVIICIRQPCISKQTSYIYIDRYKYISFFIYLYNTIYIII